MGQNKIWGAAGFNFRPTLFFLVYINDLPKAVKSKALRILFADNISISLTSPNNIQMHSELNLVLGQLNKRFKSNQLLLNFDKIYFIQFSNKIKCTSDTQTKHEDKKTKLSK